MLKASDVSPGSRWQGLPVLAGAVVRPNSRSRNPDSRSKAIDLGLHGVAMARHRPVLSQDGATSPRMLFMCLPDLFDAIFGPKM